MRRTAAALAVAVSLLAAGCSSAAGSATGPTVSEARPSLGTSASTDPAGAAELDPRSIEGPATAVIADENVRPITADADPQLPTTVSSFDSERVTVTSVDRIVAVDTNGTLGELVFSLGLGDNVVGRDLSTNFPQARAVPIVTVGGHQLNAEAMLDLDPTVVLTDSDIGPPEVQEQLRDAGIPVVFFDPERSLESIPQLITAVAETLGVAAEGSRLIERVNGELARALATAPDAYAPLRMTFLYVRGTAGVYLMAGDGSGADSLIEAIGGVDVGTELGLSDAYVPITSEALIAGAPDVILVMTKGLESVGGLDGLLEIPGLAQTPAGEHRRVIDMEDSVLLSFGPRVGATIEALSAAVYGTSRPSRPPTERLRPPSR